jgi:hypothetical protein
MFFLIFFNFDTEFLKGVQDFMALAAKIFLIKLASGLGGWQALILQIFYSNGIGCLFGIVPLVFTSSKL